MSMNTTTDLTDEDAADLQFPKVTANVYNENMIQLNSKDFECLNCYCDLSVPYIFCVVCNVNICCTCFSNGIEFLNHKSDHDYSIFDNSVNLFENSNWTAQEELILLNTLIDYGNFNLVPQYLPNRTLKEIQEHYDQFYLNRHGSDLLPSFSANNAPAIKKPVIPYRFCLNDIDNPPRYTCNSVGFQSMAGYNAARFDFELEYDSNAEDLIANLNIEKMSSDDPHYNIMTDLQCAIVRSYNRRLQERQRRKLIIRNHGLILVRKMIGWLHRYDLTVTKKVYEKMCRFIQFYTGSQFEFIMEGLHRAGELKLEIARLCEFHRQGIISIDGAKLYLKLKMAREDSKNSLKVFQNSTQFNWKIKNNLTASLIPTNLKRRGVFSPIDVVGLPGFEKLSSKEQDLCSKVRLVPLSYFEFRDILINENRKSGHVKLQTARRLLKIDVNKTRRLFDFLVQEGFINKQ